MASSNRRTVHFQREATIEDRYFIISLTNYPHMLQRTQHFQQLPNHHCPQQQQHHLVEILHSEEHEQILYNNLQIELQECIRAYLQRTRQSYPINLVFDMSNVGQ